MQSELEKLRQENRDRMARLKGMDTAAKPAPAASAGRSAIPQRIAPSSALPARMAPMAANALPARMAAARSNLTPVMTAAAPAAPAVALPTAGAAALPTHKQGAAGPGPSAAAPARVGGSFFQGAAAARSAGRENVKAFDLSSSEDEAPAPLSAGRGPSARRLSNGSHSSRASIASDPDDSFHMDESLGSVTSPPAKEPPQRARWSGGAVTSTTSPRGPAAAAAAAAATARPAPSLSPKAAVSPTAAPARPAAPAVSGGGGAGAGGGALRDGARELPRPTRTGSPGRIGSPGSPPTAHQPPAAHQAAIAAHALTACASAGALGASARGERQPLAATHSPALSPQRETPPSSRGWLPVDRLAPAPNEAGRGGSEGGSEGGSAVGSLGWQLIIALPGAPARHGRGPPSTVCGAALALPPRPARLCDGVRCGGSGGRLCMVHALCMHGVCGMCTACAWHEHGMCMACAWHVHGVSRCLAPPHPRWRV